ncbi:MAG: hypothetical protein ACK524_11915, partial [Planctomyces sp.]
CSGGKNESGGKNPVEQDLHLTRMNSWVVREKVSLKEKFPTSMNFRVKKTQLSPKLWELKKQIICDVKIGCPKK